MTTPNWNKSEAQTPLTREINRVNKIIVGKQHFPKVCLSDIRMYSFTNAHGYNVYIREIEDCSYNIEIHSSSFNFIAENVCKISSETFDHTDGRRFTRMYIYGEKNTVLSSVDIPEKRRD